jgi:hypothetical protein
MNLVGRWRVTLVFVTLVIAISAARSASDLGDQADAPAGKEQTGVEVAKRTQQVLTNFAGIKADYERLKADITVLAYARRR